MPPKPNEQIPMPGGAAPMPAPQENPANPATEGQDIYAIVDQIEEQLSLVEEENKRLKQIIAKNKISKEHSIKLELNDNPLDFTPFEAGVEQIAKTVNTGVGRISDSVKKGLEELGDIRKVEAPEIEKAIADSTKKNERWLSLVERAVKGIKFDFPKIPDPTGTLKDILSAIKNFKLPTDPDSPVPVRMSNGKEWVEQMAQIITQGGAGGGFKYKEINGTMVTTNAIGIPLYDHVSNTLSAGDTTETYVFKKGGASGDEVARVVIVYTDSNRTTISSVVKTPNNT